MSTKYDNIENKKIVKLYIDGWEEGYTNSVR